MNLALLISITVCFVLIFWDNLRFPYRSLTFKKIVNESLWLLLPASFFFFILSTSKAYFNLFTFVQKYKIVLVSVILFFSLLILVSTYLSQSKIKRTNTHKTLFVISMLVICNLIIFSKHYFHDYGFPWDFPLAYYGVPSYWTSMVSNGYFPDWVPVAQFGYPLNLNLQSGLHYPFFWIFPLLKIPYTLNAAVILQCLHILVGSVGMFFLSRKLKFNYWLAFLGALLFQLSGPMFSNSEHPDIIRAFSLLPWLLAVSTFSEKKDNASLHLLPLFVVLLFTGAYPGNIISTVFFLSLYVLIQFVYIYFYRNNKSVRKFAIGWLIYFVIGVLVSFYHIGPAFLDREYLARYQIGYDLERVIGVNLRTFPSLFLSNSNVIGEVSMSSLYLGLPAIIFLAGINLRKTANKSVIPLAFIGILSFFQMMGNNTPVWPFISKIIPPLRYSRMASSDYRFFFIIFLVVATLSSLESLANRQVSTRKLILGLAVIFAFVLMSLFVASSTPTEALHYPVSLKEMLRCIIFMFVVGAFIIIYNRTVSIGKIVFFFISLFLIILDATFVVPNIQAWKVPGISTHFKDFFAISIYDNNGNLKVLSDAGACFDTRPRRGDYEGIDGSIKAYLLGQYLMDDYAPHLLNTSAKLYSDPESYDFMEKPGMAVLIPISETRKGINDTIDVSENLLISSSSNVVSYSYCNNTIEYAISLTEPKLMVENEVYFPGWQGRILAQDNNKVINAVQVNDGFRGWMLPSGNYALQISFSYQGAEIYNIVSLLAVLLWYHQNSSGYHHLTNSGCEH